MTLLMKHQRTVMLRLFWKSSFANPISVKMSPRFSFAQNVSIRTSANWAFNANSTHEREKCDEKCAEQVHFFSFRLYDMHHACCSSMPHQTFSLCTCHIKHSSDWGAHTMWESNECELSFSTSSPNDLNNAQREMLNTIHIEIKWTRWRTNVGRWFISEPENTSTWHLRGLSNTLNPLLNFNHFARRPSSCVPLNYEIKKRRIPVKARSTCSHIWKLWTADCAEKKQRVREKLIWEKRSRKNNNKGSSGKCRVKFSWKREKCCRAHRMVWRVRGHRRRKKSLSIKWNGAGKIDKAFIHEIERVDGCTTHIWDDAEAIFILLFDFLFRLCSLSHSHVSERRKLTVWLPYERLWGEMENPQQLLAWVFNTQENVKLGRASSEGGGE